MAGGELGGGACEVKEWWATVENVPSFGGSAFKIRGWRGGPRFCGVRLTSRARLLKLLSTHVTALWILTLTSLKSSLGIYMFLYR